jgi:hypothetical protein
VHCNINPETVMVTKDGSYKLAGFQFAAPVDTGLAVAPGTVVAQPFGYPSSQPALWEELVVVSGLAGAGRRAAALAAVHPDGGAGERSEPRLSWRTGSAGC